ncbi:MAG: menaquinone biosynthesis decarboxylase [Treponema sp. GWB1_62_6]|nr:MAG: menaquinone biosynthesis decarboxylase [Treponema sp. GWB1_62_6]OHE63763.1 MAG: menaquinone biosynthesis decarboxylase [Treponema sp. GWC1_61_84]HCM27995.1 menaquinone biosynthesis decarboxylase [Treponema sp.]
MAFKDLRAFVDALRERGELKEIDAEVDRDLEITEIADRVVKAGGPALLFNKVKECRFPLLINAFAGYDRMAFALGEEGGRLGLDRIAGEIADLIDVSSYVGFAGKLQAIPKLARLACVLPLPSPFGAPCQEVVEDEVDLDAIPVLKCWPGDGGRFLTLPLVFTKEPDGGRQNVGMYRMQVYDKRTTGMHWHLHKDGRAIWEKWRERGSRTPGGGRMPVSVALGCDPAMIYAATAPLPPFIDEAMFAGFLRKAPIERTKCLTNDIMVPARAEFVLEGYIDTDEPLREEGPFGDHTGYYSLKGPYPVFHIEKITRKKNPIYNCTIVGKPPMEDCFLGKATERLFLPLLKMVVPEIVDMNFPLEGVFHNCALVSIRKKYPGQARKVMHALWGLGQMMYTKMIVIVDEKVDVQDISTVAWKVFNNIDAARDVIVVDGPLDALDHSSPLPHFGHKMGIDATKKWPEEGHTREWPDDIEMSADIRALVDGRWSEYGF